MTETKRMMVQHLKPGDLLSTVGGIVEVAQVGPCANMLGFVWAVVLTNGMRAESVPTQSADKVVSE